MKKSAFRSILIVASGFLALFAWALSSPAGSSPDDDFHLTSIWCGQGERPGICEDIGQSSVKVPENVVHSPCFARDKNASGQCQDDLSTTLVETSRSNSVEHAYPSGYYWVTSFLVGPDVQTSVLIIRASNLFIFLALTVLTVLVVRPIWRRPLLLTVLCLIVPLGMFTIASTNPSSWVLFSAAFIFLLIRSLSDETLSNNRRITILLVLTLVTATATAARSDSAFILTAAAILALASMERRYWARATPLLAAAVVATFGVFSILTSHQWGAATTGIGDDSSATRVPSIALLIRNLTDLPGLYAGIFGTWDLGWLDTPMPSTVWVGTLAVFSSLVITSIIRKKNLSELFLPLMAVALMVVVPVVVLQSSAAPVGALVQPRYVLPLLALASISLFTTKTSGAVLSQRQLNIVVATVVVANAIALATNQIRYDTGLSQITFNSPSQLAWAIGIIAVGSIAFAYCALLISSYIRAGMHTDSEFAAEDRSSFQAGSR